jgi:hypothetical protein
MPIPIPIKSKPMTVTVTDMMMLMSVLLSVFSSTKERLTVNRLYLASPLLLFHRHLYDPNSFAFPFNVKTDAVLFSLTWPVYRFPS